MEKDEIIRAAGAFLLRADIKGHEVPTFNAVMEWLEGEHSSAQSGEPDTFDPGVAG